MEFILKKDIPYFTECESIIEALGFKLVDLNISQKKGTKEIKLVISGENGVGIDDCTVVHKTLLPRLEALLDTQDTTMEVSSPGINRVLKRSTELYAFVGDEVAIWDSSITEWRTGLLKSINEDNILLNVNGDELSIPYDNIKKAKVNL